MGRSGPSLPSVCITPVGPTQALAVHIYTVERANDQQGIGLEMGEWRGWGRSSLLCLTVCKVSPPPASHLAAPAPCTGSNLPARGFCPITVAIVQFMHLAFSSLCGVDFWEGYQQLTPYCLGSNQNSFTKPHISSKISRGPVSLWSVRSSAFVWKSTE